MKMTHSQAVVGIDVSSGKLDAHVHGHDQSRQVTNDASGHRELVAWARAKRATTAVMEASGGYERDLARALRRAEFAVYVVDPKRVRHYAKAVGQLAKTDRIDARIIAEYGTTVLAAGRLALPRPDDPQRDRLSALLGARAALIEHRDALQQQSAAMPAGLARQALKDAHASMKLRIKQLERQIGALIAEHAAFAALARRLDTVPGLGPVAIAALIAWLPELGYAGRARISALVGVAPVADDSGDREGKRHIAGGRKKLRNVLYMPVVAAIRCNPVLAAYYKRLLACGKEPKVALVACMRKLLVIVTAMITNQQDWAPHSGAQTAAA
jgi:Transposase and inactivated derivatives